MARTSHALPDPAGGYLTGHLLIAMPGMQDPRFDHSVVCLCAHSADGAMGIMVNRPLAGMVFDDLLRQLKLEPVPPRRRMPLLSGGPVESGRGFVLHSDDWSTEGSLHVTTGLALTASLDILKAVADGGGPRQCVLALGYAGWAPGQLEDEIQRNAWLNVPADPALVFREDTGGTWEAALAKLRVDPALLSGAAGRA
jgi:putative transcriptional regulator